jgi:hypothetical protein
MNISDMPTVVVVKTQKHRFPLMRSLYDLGAEAKVKSNETGEIMPNPFAHYTDSRIVWRAGYEGKKIKLELEEKE